MDGISHATLRCLIAVQAFALCATTACAQNFERYRPLSPPNVSRELSQIPEQDLPPTNLDDRVLVEVLNAIIVLDHSDDVSLDSSIDDLTGLSYKFAQSDSLVFSKGFRNRVQGHIGQTLSLRSINQLARDIATYYKDSGQPIVDVQIPEQRITGGTLQIVVVETSISAVLIQPGSVFCCDELNRWIECTWAGDRVKEKNLQSDLFWLNQNPFRRVSLDFRPGAGDGTTDVIFESNDVAPIRGYIGADDTGVDSLNYGRLFAGLMYGNLFNRGGIVSYQYTADQDFAHLEAHSVSYNQPINRDYSVMTYGSWAGVSPMLGGGLSQEGESWQLGAAVTQHLIRTPNHSQNFSIGIDFKSTNNNLEFAGSTVSDSAADLVQLRVGVDDFVREDEDQYRLLKADVYWGPGGGATGSHSSAAFNTLRPGTSPDYVYGRITAEETSRIGCNWILRSQLTAQASSERLLFSETLGLGGFDTIRGFDQRTTNADHGWLANLEFGPRTYRWGDPDDVHSVRPYVFTDLGSGYLSNPRAGEEAYTFAASSGFGLRFNVSDRVTARFDWGYGWEDIAGSQRNNRVHVGLTWIPGPRP